MAKWAASFGVVGQEIVGLTFRTLSLGRLNQTIGYRVFTAPIMIVGIQKSVMTRRTAHVHRQVVSALTLHALSH